MGGVRNPKFSLFFFSMKEGGGNQISLKEGEGRVERPSQLFY
jgi:hypothetical protein